MRKRRVWASLLAIALLAFSLTACNGGGTDAAELDPDALLKEAVQKMNQAESIDMQLSMVFEGVTEDENGRPMQIALVADGSVSAIKEPFKEKADIRMHITVDRQSLNANYLMYLEEENGQIKAYNEMNLPPELDESDIEMPFENGEMIGSAEEVTAGQKEMNFFTAPEIIGTDTVDGKDAIHLLAKIDLSKIPALQELMGEGMTAEDTMALQFTLKMLNIKADFWMDADTHDLLKVEMDIGDQLDLLLQVLMPLMEEDSGLEINDLGLKVTMTGFNSVQDFEVPVGLKASKGEKTKT